MAKAKPLPMGKYSPTTAELDAREWCMQKRIMVYAWPVEGGRWKTGVTLGGKDVLGPETYSKGDILKKIYEYYLYYFNKYKDQL
jgi:hypothetical protein